ADNSVVLLPADADAARVGGYDDQRSYRAYDRGVEDGVGLSVRRQAGVSWLHLVNAQGLRRDGEGHDATPAAAPDAVDDDLPAAPEREQHRDDGEEGRSHDGDQGFGAPPAR